MTDHQVLVFGSFTEEEIISSLQCQPKKSNLEITFGSLDSETLRSIGIYGTRLTELQPTKGCELVTSRHNNTRCPHNTNNKVQSNDGLVEVNGCTSPYPGDNSKKQLNSSHIEQSLSVTSDCTYEILSSTGHRSPESVNQLSSSLDDVVLDDSPNGFYQVVSKETNGHYATPTNFVPRGLVNLGNLCFLNATLQALLSCSPFFELLHKLRHRIIPEVGYPTLSAFVEFISDFDSPTDSICERKEKTVPETGLPFRPVMFDTILKSFTPEIADNLSGRPRQEDAQEFLSFIMHQMHDELLKLDGQISNENGKAVSLVSSTDDEDEDANWEIVGPKNKTAITRTQSFIPSDLSAIFGGKLKSVVKAKGYKASATIQPFLLLHLSISPDPVFTVEDALQLFSAPETLDGYQMSAAGKAEVVNASKSVKILDLPGILVLHLMRFSYGSQGSTKLHKDVPFPLTLDIDRELLASPSSGSRRYELVATITHHGRDPWKGHYTADARHPSGKWLRYDDSSVTPIPESKVLHDQAYVLFYRQL